MKPYGNGRSSGEHEIEASTAALHGVLVRVLGSGVLISGESGIGKSSCALELVSRGHALIADDVIVAAVTAGKVFGSAPSRFAGLLEVRGLGIVNVRDLFGTASFAASSQIDLCVELVDESESADKDPFFSDYQELDILGLKIRKVQLMAKRGRNVPLLVETAVRLLRNGSWLTTIACDHDQFLAGSSV